MQRCLLETYLPHALLTERIFSDLPDSNGRLTGFVLETYLPHALLTGRIFSDLPDSNSRLTGFACKSSVRPDRLALRVAQIALATRTNSWLAY